jgi:Tfp pilus assembly protein PilN
MIKINLLSEGKRPAAVRKAKAGAASAQDLALWMLVLGAFAGVLAAAGYWWLENGRLHDKQTEVAQAQKQVEALAAVIKEVDDFKAKKKNLTDKIGVINELKSNQRGPVRVMDYVSRALPELLWLDRMKMNAGSIELEGRAFNPNAVANYLENLDKVPEFKEPVLKDTSAQSNSVYKFLITFDYSFAPKKVDETAGGPGAGTPGKPGAGGKPGGAPAGGGGPQGAPGAPASRSAAPSDGSPTSR